MANTKKPTHRERLHAMAQQFPREAHWIYQVIDDLDKAATRRPCGSDDCCKSCWKSHDSEGGEA